MKNLVKSSFKNIFDGVITSLIGTGVMIMTIIMLWTRDIGFMWEGVLGLVVGCILLIAPRDISSIAKGYFSGESAHSTSEEDVTTPPNPPRKI